jgi:hypothetical protein
MEVNDLVRIHNHKYSGRIINMKILKYPFGQDIHMCQVEYSDGMKEWVNEHYLTYIEDVNE